MSTNRMMHAGSWTKLILMELKDLYAACGLSVEGNKKELGERLHAYFDKRKDNDPKAQSKESSKGQKQGLIITRDRMGEVVDMDSDDDGKEKVSSVPVDVFLTALSSIERKIDKSFSALYREIEEEDSLEEAWPKVKLSKLHDQYEYDFLAKIGRHLDKVIRMLPDSVKKEVVSMHDEVESRAITLRLADDRDWELRYK
ncbi:12415_t:CDS:2 [Dentiscutata heterogama]|uniref:12415_t:CDS:1 n=1 Tax=Dentiscutata heterogama TaxID=1316150 RepID=A0ACA9NQE4_9GLOM|nr:12415_t:CDS:2 [Dentiscutata heterogama]